MTFSDLSQDRKMAILLTSMMMNSAINEVAKIRKKPAQTIFAEFAIKAVIQLKVMSPEEISSAIEAMEIDVKSTDFNG